MPRRIRPPSASDASAVLDLILARDVAVVAPDFTFEDLEADWSRPGLALEHDARVAVGRAAASMATRSCSATRLVFVHPGAEREGTVPCSAWAEVRAAERGTAVLRQFAFGSNDGARRHLNEAATGRSNFRLRADLADVPPARRPAAGIRPDDEAAVHRLIQDAFEEIEGNTPQTLDEWRSKGLAKSGHDPALWLLLDDDEGLVGAALGERWEDGIGYVAELGVAARARGRGYGRALLLGLFAAFRRAGLRHAELSVHGRNRGRSRCTSRRDAHGVGGRALGEATWTRLTSARSRTALARRDVLGLDTEFLPEGRYRPLLCLVQVVVGEDVWVLDPLAGSIPPRSPACWPILRSRSWSTPAARTSRSCGASGARTSPTCSTRRSRRASPGFSAQAGYNGLLHDVLKVRLPKRASFTRWDARPLTDEQVHYARGDVEHLLPLADDFAAPWASAAGSSGHARSAARSPTRSDERDPEDVGGGCRASTGSTRGRARSRASWRPGASAPPSARTGRSARSCATRRSSSWPSARRRTATRSRRSAASTPTSCVVAAATWWPRSSAAARRRRSARRGRPAGDRLRTTGR